MATKTVTTKKTAQKRASKAVRQQTDRRVRSSGVNANPAFRDRDGNPLTGAALEFRTDSKAGDVVLTRTKPGPILLPKR
jgi:hypothetical protein